MQVIKPSRRGLITGAAALAAFSALGIEGAEASPFVAATSISGGSGGPFTTPAINTTGANLIAIAQVFYAPNGSSAGTDNKGNTYLPITGGSSTYNTTNTLQVTYCQPGANVGAGHTFTLAGTFGFMCVAAFNTAAASSPLDTTTPVSNAVTSATSVSPGAFTPGQANSLILALMTSVDTSGPATYAAGSGFSIASQAAPSSGVSVGGALAYLWQGPAAAVNPSCNGWTGSSNAGAIQLAFKLTAGPAGSSSRLMFRPIP